VSVLDPKEELGLMSVEAGDIEEVVRMANTAVG
jgi:hypothetical protein